MKCMTQYKGLPKSIYILFLATVVNRMGDFIYPFLTLFLKTKIGLEADQIGNILLWSSVLYIVATGIGGKLADWFNRKYLYSFCTIISIGLMAICGFMKEDFTMVIILIGSQIFLRMAAPAMDALKMDLTVAEDRQTAFSLIYLGINVGVSVGHFMAGILFVHHIRLLFIGDVLTSLCALALIMIYVKDNRRIAGAACDKIEKIPQDMTEEKKEEKKTWEQATEGSIFRVMIKRPKILLFCVICAVLSFIYAQGNFVLPLHLEAIYLVEIGSRYFGFLMALNAIVVVLMTPFILSVTKKNKAMFNIMLASICYTIGFGMYGLWADYVGFAIGTVIWTIGEILYSTNAGVYIANHSPSSHRGRFQSIYTILKGMGRALAPVVMGHYLMHYTLVQSWYLVAGIGIISTLFILVIMDRKRKMPCKKESTGDVKTTDFVE